MKAIIEMTRTIHQQKRVEVELTDEQIEQLCEEHEITPNEITYGMCHYMLVDGGNGDAMALDEDGWENSKLEQDKADWDGCCDELHRDDGSIDKYDWLKGFNL